MWGGVVEKAVEKGLTEGVEREKGEGRERGIEGEREINSGRDECIGQVVD